MEASSRNGSGGIHDSIDSGNSGMSRAERFEDEKRRIVDSCFGKKDEDGSRKLRQEDNFTHLTLNSYGVIHHAY